MWQGCGVFPCIRACVALIYNLCDVILGLWGGPWHGLHRPSYYVGPHGFSSTCIVTKRSPKPILGATEGFHQKSNFEKISGVTKQPIQRENGQVLTRKRPYVGGGGDWGSRVPTGVPGVGIRDPHHGLGDPYRRKKLPKTQVQIHTHRPQYAKKF